MTGATNEIWDIIEEAEKDSAQICEICGNHGSLKEKGHWYKTLCDTCTKEYGYNTLLIKSKLL